MKRTIVLLAVLILLAMSAGTLWLSSQSTPRAAVVRAWGRLSYRAVTPSEGDMLLPVPFDPQDHALSSEAASLKMALAYRGIVVSEDDILAVVGYDPTVRTKDADGSVRWGNPNEAFVGDIDGRMMSTGYGVHWSPIARAANEWRLAQEIQGWKAGEVARQIELGNPVIAWISGGSGTTWSTANGALVNAGVGFRAVVLNGFRGDAESPEGVYFIDSVYGQGYEPTEIFFERWAPFGSAGVILY